MIGDPSGGLRPPGGLLNKFKREEGSQQGAPSSYAVPGRRGSQQGAPSGKFKAPSDGGGQLQAARGDKGPPSRNCGLLVGTGCMAKWPG